MGCVQPPTNLAASVSGADVMFSLTAPTTPTTSYVIEAGLAQGRADIGTFDLGNAAASYSVSSVPLGRYFIRVRSKNSCGISAPSNEAAIVIAATGRAAPRLGRRQT